MSEVVEGALELKPPHGSPDLLPPRIAAKIEPELMSGCWLWTASLTRNGYGRPVWQGRMEYAHRLVYMLLVGPIPDGLELDHLCRNRACVSPWHLEPVTRRTNIMRGVGPERTRLRPSPAECPKGHPFDETNTRWSSSRDGKRCRHCRECERVAWRAWNLRRRAS